MQQDAGIVASAPTEWGKGLRCCVPCQLVKTFEQFYEQGCENCPYLAMDGDRERIYDATTTDFHVGFTGTLKEHTHTYAMCSLIPVLTPAAGPDLRGRSSE